jgi:hypothetical protein
LFIKVVPDVLAGQRGSGCPVNQVNTHEEEAMQRPVRLLLLVAGILLMSAGTPAQDKTDVSGMWDVTIESPQRTFTTLMTLKADGEKVTGAFKGQTGELPVSGSIKGNEIKVAYTVNFQGNDLVITMTGTFEKDSLKGTADFGGFATGPWSGVRHKEGQGTPAAAASAAPASSDSVNITGAWAFTIQTDQGSGSPTFTFKQEGEKLGGMYKGMFGEAPVQGTVKGKEINFSIKVNAQGVDATIVYTGTIEKDSMKGTVKLGDLGEGTWTAKRQ